MRLRSRARKSAAQSSPYTKAAKRADVRNGRRDGRKQLPTYSGLLDLVETRQRISAPYQERLVRDGLHEINEQYRIFKQHTHERQEQLAGLRGALAEAERLLERALRKLAEARAEPTELDLQPRNPYELALAGTPGLYSRRAAVRHERVEAALEAVDRQELAVEGLRRQIEEAGDLIDQEFALAQARGRGTADYLLMRVATYWDAVVQTHREGRNLAAVLPPVAMTPPDWFSATCVGGVVSPAPEPPEAWDGDAQPRQPAGAGTSSTEGTGP